MCISNGAGARSIRYHAEPRMELLKDTPFEVAWWVWQAKPPHPSMTVVVKGTFEIGEGPLCTIASEQKLPTGDEHHDGDPELGLRYASDLEPLKPRGECLVVGSVRSDPATARLRAGFRIGPVHKQLALFGDRVWKQGSPSLPVPFESLALSWENAYGGPGVRENPIGKGVREIAGVVALPNIEDPEALLLSRGQRARPIGPGPIPRTWASRARWAGTYDAAWLAERYPALPEDLDWRFFNAAPADQQIDGYFRGDEEIVLTHLHPRLPHVAARLPGLYARAFVSPVGSQKLRDIGLVLDTIVVDAEKGLACCVWRGVVQVARADLSDLAHLYVVHEEGSRPADLASVQARYDASLSSLAAERMAAEAVPPPTSSTVLRVDLLALLDPSAPGAKWAHLDQAMTVPGDESALKNAIADLTEASRRRKTALRSVFEDAIGLGSVPSMDRELTAEERLDLELHMALGEQFHEEHDPLRAAVIAAARAGESLRGRDLSGANLSALDLSGCDLSDALLVRANLSGARLSNVNLAGAQLGKAELSRAIFEDCTLDGADLTNARAERVHMTRTSLNDASLVSTYLRQARFSACKLVLADISESDLSEAEVRDSILDGADLSGCTLTSTVMMATSLADTRLEGVQAKGLRLDGCRAPLLRASDGSDFEGASFRKAVLDGARFGGARLRGANLSLAKLKRADFSGAFMLEAVLMGCDLRGARFDGASLIGASFLKSNLMQARLPAADLRRADLRGTNLYQAELLDAKLDEARTDLADLSGTRIE